MLAICAIDKGLGRAERPLTAMRNSISFPVTALRAVSLASLVALLAGCATAPADQTSAVPAGQVRATAAFAPFPEGQWPADAWWLQFGDPQLDTLVTEGLAGSPDIAIAAARMRRADAIAREAAGGLYPRLDAAGAGSLDRRSYNTGFPKEFVPKGWLDSGQVSATASFEPDLWGRNRAAVAAAFSEAEATAIEAREAQLALASTIAAAYFDFARLQAERDIRRDALKVREETLRIVSGKFAAGMETRGSVRQAEAQVAQARSLLGATVQAATERGNQIAALVGAGPDRALALARPALGEAMPARLPPGATTALMARRADIAAARARVEAATGRIAVARADFFPAIRLDAMLGLQALGIGKLLESDSLVGSVGPAVSLPLFRGGALRARYRHAEAGRDEAIAFYNAAVVGAYREVADAVTAQASLVRRLEGAREARAAMEDAYRIARLRYQGGLSNYLDVLAVEDRLLEARLAEATLEAAARGNNVTLIRALGGGYGSGEGQPTDG